MFDTGIYIIRKNAMRKILMICLSLLFMVNIIYGQSNDADSFSKTGNDFLKQGKYVEAEKAFTRAIELNNQLSNYYNDRGYAYYKMDKFPQAIDDFTKALELPMDYTKANNPLLPGTVQVFVPDPAFTEFNRFFNGRDYFSVVYLYRGLAYLALKKQEQAISDFDNAIKLDSEYILAYYNRGAAHGQLDRFDQAISDYTQVIKFDSEHVADAYFHRGSNYGKLNLFDQAISDFTQVIKLDPKYAEAYFYRAFSRLNKSNRDGIMTDNLARLIINDLNQFLILDPVSENAPSARSYLSQLRQRGY